MTYDPYAFPRLQIPDPIWENKMKILPKPEELQFVDEHGQEWEVAPGSITTYPNADSQTQIRVWFHKKQTPAITREEIDSIYRQDLMVVDRDTKIANLIIETVERRAKK